MILLSDACSFLAPIVDNGVASTDARVVARINEATERLLAQGDWVNSLKYMRYNTYNPTITMPYDVEKLIGVTIDSYPVSIYNPIYSFLENGPGDFDASHTYRSFMDLGEGYATFFDIPGQTSTVLALFANDYRDCTAPVCVYGQDAMQNDIVETLTPNYWLSGIEGSWGNLDTIKLGSSIFKKINRISKPVTNSYLSLYAWDGINSRAFALCKYNARETEPSYRRYKIRGIEMPKTVPDSTGYYNHAIYGLVKKRYTPASAASDQLLIQSLPALKMMCLAITRENAGDLQNAVMYEQKAVMILQSQLSNNRTPADNFFQVDQSLRLCGDVTII